MREDGHDVGNDDDDDAEGARIGRPPKITADAETLSKIEGLARIQCTHAEAADVMGIARSTFTMFLTNNKEAFDAWDRGGGKGRASLRRHQFKLAESGNATMQIWLGKQWLEQTDKNDTTLRGHDGGPLEMVHLLGKLTSSVCPIDEKNDEPDSV